MASIEELKHIQIPLKDISIATNNFSEENLIAVGGFGRVYHGKSEEHGLIAIKRLIRSRGQGDREFMMEIALLSVYKHENIVSLLGFCDEDGEKILVYKLESNGSLEKHLDNRDLNWTQRLRICIDAARGLKYLHDDVGSQHRILHRDVKSSNILLDEDWKAKISDFGLSKIGPANMQHTFLISDACGTIGYIDPEYMNDGILTQKSDVYSFGVVLFEVLFGRPAYVVKPGEKHQLLAKLAKNHHKEGTLDQVIDSGMRNQMVSNSLKIFSLIACQCLDDAREKRPLMSDVVEQLETALYYQLASRDEDSVTYPYTDIRRSTEYSSHLWNYDVFISFKGEDTPNIFVDSLYSALVERLVRTYKDDKAHPGNESNPSSFKAIRESQIVVIIFSKNYASSSCCLNELVYIMNSVNQRRQAVMPIFDDVDPSDVKDLNGEFGEEFAKQARENSTKVESWRKALVDASNLPGWESKHIGNRHESLNIEVTIDTILDKLFSLNSDVDEDLVGMRTRLQDLKSALEIGSIDVRMIGLWGLGGAGKTTLATSVFKEVSGQFESHCIVDNIREESGKYGPVALQEKMLSTVSNERVEVRSVYEGIRMIKSRLRHRNVLIVLDDVDEIDQLEALAGSAEWFGVGSRIIITTRDRHVLTSHRVDTVFAVGLLSLDEAIQLFNRHAYRTNKPVEDYDRLSLPVVSFAAGLPLSIKILGSFLYEKDKKEWLSTLKKLKNIPFSHLVDKLKISYDGLDSDKKQLFLDIACFLRREEKNTAMRILDACYPGIGVKVLMEKALITISNGKFDMHDLVQELGHYIVRGEYGNPVKHSRIWSTDEIDDMSCENETTANNIVEAIKYDGKSSYFPELVSKMKKLRFLWASNFEFRYETRGIEAPTYLSNELRYIHLSGYLATPLPENFQPTKLVVLNLDNSLQKELWKGYKQLPCLKELHLSDAHGLVRTPDFGGLPCLQKLTLNNCGKLEEIHPSLGNHKSIVNVSVHHCDKLRIFPTIIWMKNLETLEILDCNVFGEFPAIQGSIDSLISLSLINVGIQVLPASIGKYCTNLILLKLEGCQQLESIGANFQGLKHLQKLVFTGRAQLQRLPKDLLDEKSLEDLHVPQMRQPLYPSLPFIDNEVLSYIGELSNLQELHLSESYFARFDVSLSQLTQLKLLNLTHCEELVELPELPSSIAILIADSCYSLKVSGAFYKNCKWLSQVSLRKVRIVSDGDVLLQSMLQGKAIENHSISLRLHGLEIPMRFIPPLLKGTTCTLQLPENWCNHFSGFLMCAAVEEGYSSGQYITMKHEKGSSTGMDSQPRFWKEFYGGVTTWVGYVSFGSLRHTKWWEPRSTVVSFSIKFSYTDPYKDRQYDTGFGVRLVPRRRESGPTETPATDSSSEFSDKKKGYIHEFKINRDSKSALEIVF